MLTITLDKVTGQDKDGNEITEEYKYAATKIRARMVRRAVEITEGMDEKNFTTNDLDTLVNYVVELFGSRFTINDVYDGLDADKLVPELMRCMKNVMGSMQDHLSPNAQTVK